MSDSVLHKGRGATQNALSARFDDPAREADGDWRDDAPPIDGDVPAAAHDASRSNIRKTIIDAQHRPGRAVRSLDQRLPGVRAWLHLLLRAANPRVS